MYEDSSSLSSLGQGLWFLAVYVYTAYTLQTMAKKTSTPNGWLAWIPLVNIFLLVKVAGKSYWWVLWLLIPLVNLVIVVLVYMSICKRLGKPAWLGVLILIPLVNLVLLGYLAFAKGGAMSGSMKPPMPTASMA